MAPLGAPENFAPFCYPPASFFFILRAIWIFKMMHFPSIYVFFLIFLRNHGFSLIFLISGRHPPSPHPKGGFDTNHKITPFLKIISPMSEHLLIAFWASVIDILSICASGVFHLRKPPFIRKPPPICPKNFLRGGFLNNYFTLKWCL